MKLKKLERIDLKSNPTLNEVWIQNEIANDPSILGLGDLILKDKERIQPTAGRLDILLQDSDNPIRYEVEIQLGKTDEKHIIRTIEYWDIEKRRYPQYEHNAVIVAEEITSRFFNVINLFNGQIPIYAFQMDAFKVNENEVFLNFTKILSPIQLGLPDEDEEVNEPKDRNYWENEKSNSKSISAVDKLLEIIHEFAPGYELKYNKHYIGLSLNNHSNNFVYFKPRRSNIRLFIKLDESKEIQEEIDNANIETLPYELRTNCYRLILDNTDIDKNKELLMNLMKQAFENQS